ncbi:ATP-dependent DNA helicase [Trichonephila clavipes]|nr:ATP-dependent DNA helicase [Trichonephila clavipes]
MLISPSAGPEAVEHSNALQSTFDLHCLKKIKWFRKKSDLRHNYTDNAWLRERASLAAKNLDVDAINFKLQQSLPGNEITFKSIDTVVDPDEVVNYPVEILNSLDLPGMPPHNL